MSDLLNRVSRLETSVEKVHADLGGVKERLASLEGKISNMPTTFQMATWFVGVALGLISLTAVIAFSVVRLMGS